MLNKMVIGLLILVFATSTLNPTVLLGKEVDIDQEVDVDHLDSEGLPEIILKQNPSVRNDIIPKAADDLVTLRIMYVINRQVKLEVYDYVPQSNLYKFFRDGTEIFSTTKYSDFNLYIDTVPSVGNYVYYAEISNETQTSISRNMTVHTGLMYGYTWEEDLTLAQGEYTIAARGPWYDEYEHEGFDVCHGNLTISSGATIRFQDGAKLWVNDGGIIAESNSKENPIRFIGPETRDAQIEISLDSKGNVFRNCTFVNLKGIMCNNMITSQYLDKGGIYIVDSYLHNNTYGVFSFGSSPWLERCDITQNEIGLTNRGGTNFLTGATYHGKPVIRHCNIYHNTQFGVHSLDSQGYKVDARYNWWGSGTGPYHPGTNPDGTGDNVSALVNYNPWIGLDPEITEVRVIQTIENYSLVAKKPTMVRVFLKCSQDLYNYEVALCIEYDTTYGQNSFDLSSTDSSCVLDFSCMNAPNPYKKTWSKKEKMQGLDSVNFIIPKYQLPTGIGTVTVKAELILDDPSTDPNPENNVKNITMAVGMQKEPLRIKFVPLKVGEWTNFTSDHQKEYLQAAEKHKEFIAATYPVSDIRFSVDMDYDITTDNTYLSYDGETIIKKLHDNFKRSGYDRVVGLFPDGYWDAEKDGYDGLSDTSFTLFGYNWWYSSVIAKDTDPGATAHEMGHTHGLPAKGSGGEEYNLPEFKNAIMMKANPAQGWWVSKGASGCIYGPFTEGFGYYCFMGLSKTDSFNKWWICNEDYDVLYKALVTTEGSTKGALKSIMNKTLIGMGSMVNNSIGYDVNFDILEVFDGVTKYHEIESDYCVLALDSSGNEISRVNITSFWFNDTLRFYFEIPYSNNIDSIELYHNSIKITDVSGNASGITISLTDVNVTDSNPDYRKINISWATNATDVNLDYSVNNGETWDPIASGLSGNGYVWNASIWKLQNNISIRATVMDGWMPVHSSMNISLDIVNRPPIVGIISPKNDVLIAKDVTILFEGFAIDPEDGFLDGNQTRWYSSLDGFLGYGGYLSLDNLSNGDHIITFTVTESNGLFSNATLSVRVGQDYLSPNVIPSEEIKVVTSGSFFNITFEAEDDYGILLSYAIFGNETYYLYDTLVNNTFVLRMTAPSEPGEYKINVFFEDHAGNTEDQDVVLLVTNPASSDDFNFVIVTPREGDRYNPNENITFRCEIFNMDGDDARAEWYSDKDGYLGEGFQILKNLSNNQHNITVQIYVNNVIIASRCVDVLVEETIILSTIQALSIAYTGNNIYTLSWTAVCEADSMFAEYRIYVSDSELSIGTLIENITDINQTTYQLGLEPGSSYWISVIWTDTTGSESNPYRLKVDISKSSSDMISGLSRVNEQMGLIIMLAGAGALVIVLFASRRRNRTTVLTETHNEPAQEQQDQDDDDTKQINEELKGMSK